ncbi:hypothetical protein [Oscillibacter sp.]|nr:hypothetical protein [Oscillibacter sp.]
MSEAQARRMAAMLTEKQRRDFLLLAQIIRSGGDAPPRTDSLR